jgi:FlaA1/EpsC-like NDP-sugar epimerase
MGEPVKIIELARRMITMSGLTVREPGQPEGEIEIMITGLRPGEKLYEELLIGENPMPTQHRRIMRAREDFLPWDELTGKLMALAQAARDNDVTGMKRVLAELVRGSKLAEANFDHLSVA